MDGNVLRKNDTFNFYPALGGTVTVGSTMRVTVLKADSYWLALGLLKEGLEPVTERSYSNAGAYLHVVSVTNNGNNKLPF